jgi:LEA14-like dessication related protein
MKLKPLEIAGLLGLAYLLFGKVGSYLSNAISVGSIKMKLLNTTPAGTTLRLFIPVANSASVSYPFELFQGNLFYGNYPLGQVYVPGPVTIPANGSTTIQTDVQISFANLGNQIVQMILSGEWLNAISVKGTLTASGVKFPISQNISLV